MKPSWNPLQRIWNMYREGSLPHSVSSAVSESNPQHLAFLRQMHKELHQPGSHTIPLATWEVVVVDLETTGFHATHGDEIISIGAVAMKGTEILEHERFATYVNPNRAIPEHIGRLTGITLDTVKTAPDLTTALSQFFQFVGNRTLVAHHSRHERDFFQAALWKTSRSRFSHRLLDTLLIIRLCDTNIANSSLDALCSRHMIEIGKRHDAYEDALATAKLWRIYLEKIIMQGFTNLHEVYQQAGSQHY